MVVLYLTVKNKAYALPIKGEGKLPPYDQRPQTQIGEEEEEKMKKKKKMKKKEKKKEDSGNRNHAASQNEGRRPGSARS